MAHIHMAPAGSNGGIVVWLYPGTTPGIQAPLGQGRLDGVIAQGVFTAANFTGGLLNQPMSALVHAIESDALVFKPRTAGGEGGDCNVKSRIRFDVATGEAIQSDLG